MVKDKKVIAVIFGGKSGEYDVSCVSASYVIESMDKTKYDVVKVGISKEGVWFVYNGATSSIKDLTWLKDKENLVPAVISPCTVQHGIFTFNKSAGTFGVIRIDVAFPLIHGVNGEDGTLQGLLTLAGIPFVGSKTCSSAVCMDKEFTKKLCGVKTVPYVCVKKKEIESSINKAETELGYPLFVKPSNSGSSLGASKAENRSELMKAIDVAFEYDEKILIEKFVDAKEIEVAVLGNNAEIVSVCGQICAGGVYDYETKYVTDKARLVIPAEISDETAENVRDMAAMVYKSLGCESLARVDFFVCGDEVYFNEINTIPGFTSISMYPKLIMSLGFTYTELIDMLIESAGEGREQ